LNSKKVEKRHVILYQQHRFRKVKSLQLYQWEFSLQGGTHREKPLYISEYILEKFRNANDKNKIIHDFRFVTMDTKSKRSN